MSYYSELSIMRANGELPQGAKIQTSHGTTVLGAPQLRLSSLKALSVPQRIKSEMLASIADIFDDTPVVSQVEIIDSSTFGVDYKGTRKGKPYEVNMSLVKDGEEWSFGDITP